ncbi:TetR/AcrR family transcriptional regulator [Effusibacillus pohliae]|uniref:TetR/AcrR family transcriptional regulator n=1 Tax=Effusibacillus pohliae TaxID=232270 RepID=UPI000360F139|nr:TetR/AcrR family transcriptional regulator [Effusibacillus pohliae]
MKTRERNTRAKLIEAAYKVLAAKGYENCSIKDIAHEAGVSPGLVHYYFANKEELLVAVVKEATDAYCRQMEQMRETVAADQLADAALAEPLERTRRNAEWYKLRYELYVLALRNPTIRSGVKELFTRGREGIEETIQAVAGKPLSNGSEMSAILFACFEGLALQSLVDPDFDLEGAYRILGQMAKQFVQSQLTSEGK